MQKAFTAKRIFTGQEWKSDAAVITENNKVADVMSISDLPAGIEVVKHGDILAPAFIDIQIYGASSRLFAVYPVPDSLDKLREHCCKGGTKYFLPTIATNTYEVFKKGIDAVREYWEKGGAGVLGLHIEGPWINAKKRGAHIEKFIHSPDLSEVKYLVEYGKGVIKMITLAPEVCTKKIIDYVKSQDIILSAGHSNGTFDEMNEAFANGIPLATHLFNAMSPLHHREPGFPGAVLLHPKVKASIVADGYHVDFSMVKLARKLMGERLFLITDAVTETNEGPYPHKLSGEKYESNGILSGSALTMMKAVKNCVEKCDISLDEALRMASLLPAKALGIGSITGKIQKGYNADFVMMDDKMVTANCL